MSNEQDSHILPNQRKLTLKSHNCGSSDCTRRESPSRSGMDHVDPTNTLKVTYCDFYFESTMDLINSRVSVCVMTAKQDVRWCQTNWALQPQLHSSSPTQNGHKITQFMIRITALQRIHFQPLKTPKILKGQRVQSIFFCFWVCNGFWSLLCVCVCVMNAKQDVRWCQAKRLVHSAESTQTHAKITRFMIKR